MTPVDCDRQHPVIAVPSAPERFYQGLILSLINALEYHKSHTSRHALHVTAFSVHLARNLRGSLISLADVFWGALLHDIGKIAVPQRILQTFPSRYREQRPTCATRQVRLSFCGAGANPPCGLCPRRGKADRR
ncbi:MAG: Metal dependent phosphohydrolase [Clostridia bacterium 62_21]|nr:MAG: Metal dependent phosphohydrolase [Clostridia bacterium 62_21]